MVFVRELTRGEHTYYELVESYRNEDGEPRTRVIEYLGKTPHQTPGPFELTGVDFGRLAIPMMEETLTPEDVLEFLEDMGHPIDADELEEVGIRFLFQENRILLSVSLSEPEPNST